MSNGYRTITQRVRAPQRTERRYTPYQKRGSYYKRKSSETSRFGYTRTGWRLFRRDVAKLMEQQAEPKYAQDDEAYDRLTNVVETFIYREGQRISFCGAILPGTGNYSNRIGNRITMTSLQIRMVISPFDVTDGDISTILSPVFILRMIIFTWRDDSEPHLNDIIDGQDDGGNLYDFFNVNQPLNFDKRVKRKIWYDETTYHYNRQDPGTAMSTVQEPVCYKNIYIPIRKFKQVYYSNEDVPEQIGVNKIYCWLFSNVTNPVYSPPHAGQSFPVYLSWRLNYKDV